MKLRTYTEPLFFRSSAPELIVDNFAGGGGASYGIGGALRSPDLAINHDSEAVLMHMANHPHTRHFCENVWRVDPVAACAGRPVGLMWMSPDCKHFSKAKGARPVEKRIRGLAWVGLKWAKLVKPRVIVLENVEEFREWGPLLANGKPCPLRKGKTFKAFVSALERVGYTVDWRDLRACDYGAPTTRKRLFLIARCDGQPITWPAPTHGPGLLPYRTAADCIDWSIPCRSIFDRKRPLAPATLRRIARGVMKYVVNCPEPFLVPTANPLAAVIARIGQTGGNGKYANDVRMPLTTVTTKAEHLLVVPTLINTRNGERKGQAPRCLDINQPYTTVTALGSQGALVAAFLAKHNGVGEKMVVGQDLRGPTHTITATDQKALVAVAIVHTGGNNGYRAQGSDVSRQGARDRSAPGRDGLETAQSEQDSAARTAPLGDEGQGRLPDREGMRGRPAVRGGRASAGVDGTERTDTGGLGAEPRGWEQGQQPSRQPNTDDARAEPQTRVPNGSTQPFADARELCDRSEVDESAGSFVRVDRQGARNLADHGVPGHAKVAAFIIKYYGTEQDPRLQLPLSTVTTKDRFGLVTVKIAGEEYAIVDIGMRMLSPRELFRAQGFPEDYIIGDDPAQGVILTKSAQVRMCGNSVCPPVARAIVEANFAERTVRKAA